MVARRPGPGSAGSVAGDPMGRMSASANNDNIVINKS